MSNNQPVKRETMYERIKRMDEEELKTFIYFVYRAGNLDGQDHRCDDHPSSYFRGGGFLNFKANILMPNDSVYDLIDTWELDRWYKYK